MDKYKGIDVSSWQGVIDWNKVKNAGVQFAMIREGYGKSDPKQVDKYFHKNIKEAQEQGINCGVYHYSYAKSTNDAINEADFCLQNIKDYRLEYPVAFDIEDNSMNCLGRRTLTDICKAFCNRIEKGGYYVCIYTNSNWLENYLYKDELLNDYDLWLAHWYSDKPKYQCGIWQHSDKGNINGINGDVDLDISYKNYPQMMKSKGLNGFKSEDKRKENYFTYTIKKGDTLWSLAQKYLGSGKKYNEIKKLNNLKSDTIYVGQTLKMPR